MADRAGKLVAVGNLKGGAGKTVAAVNLACALAAHGRVRLVDADAQGTAAAWGAAGRLPVEVLHLPLAAETSRAIEAWCARLVQIREDVAIVVVDLPPNLGAATAAALTLADLFVVPVTPSGMDLRATEKAMALLRHARQVRGDSRPACLLLPSRVDRRTASGREIEGVLSDFEEPVAPAVVQRAAHVDAFTAGEWIGAYAPRSAGHVEIEAVAAVVRRMLAR